MDILHLSTLFADSSGRNPLEGMKIKAIKIKQRIDQKCRVSQILRVKTASIISN